MKKVIIAAFLLLTSTSVFGQNELKIGYVDSQAILAQFPAAIKAQSDLDALVSQWNKTIDSLSQALQSEYADFQKQSATMTQEKQREIGRALVQKEQFIREFNQKKFGQPNGELYQKQDQLLAPVKQKILEAIEAVSKEEGMKFVFDKSGDILLLYADSTFDITFKVLDKLKRGK